MIGFTCIALAGRRAMTPCNERRMTPSLLLRIVLAIAVAAAVGDTTQTSSNTSVKFAASPYAEFAKTLPVTKRASFAEVPIKCLPGRHLQVPPSTRSPLLVPCQYALQLMKKLRATKKLPTSDLTKNQTRKEINSQTQQLLGDLNYQKCKRRS